MSWPGVGRVGERTMPGWRLLARQGMGWGCCNCHRGSHSFPPSPQEDFPVLLPLPSAQGHMQSSLDTPPSLYLWQPVIEECQRSLRAFGESPSVVGDRSPGTHRAVKSPRV